MGLPVVVEEVVASRLAAAVGYAAWLLNHIDPTERITHVALAAALIGEGAMGWRTRSEHAASPTSGSFDAFGREREQIGRRRVGKEWVSRCRSRWSPYH